MSNPEQHTETAPQVADDLRLSDLAAALSAGWNDFAAQPKYGLSFGAALLILGLAMSYFMAVRGELAWLIPAVAGFPLIAPFVAVGFYEISRRLEVGLPIGWGTVLGALRGRGDEQILSMGVIVFVAFGFWLMVAHGIVAIFLVETGAGSESLAMLVSPAGITMLTVGSVIGGIMALAFYAITVISLPMLVDREIDFLTAIICSLKAFRANLVVMLAWAAFIAISVFLAMLPLFLGLPILLPVLGHATWHLYRRAVLPN